jgi:Arc/MetJ-type ribon-helix-helix transcriptional regulator
MKSMKKPISATIEEDIIEWISRELKDRRKYRNKSHLIEVALENLKNLKK